ncbi:MAG: transposase [Denitromonas halophila]|nr:MAG: transposase [Denitromonas halophila]TVT63927.1 MAG: transposase [Denitromonas halophila]
MIRLASIVETFRDDLLTQYGARLSADQVRALNALGQCRSAASPMMQLGCSACEHRQLVPHSCGHRLCPHCQHHESEQWLQRQRQAMVPADYFLLTFTLPVQLRALARRQSRVLFDALMRCSWATVSSFARNDRQLQGTPGAIAVLHTHNRRLDFHPHVHLLVPAAALDDKRQRWRARRRAKSGRPYLFNAKALAKVFRARMLAALAAAGLSLAARAPAQWVAHCKSVGHGDKALLYLGRYLYRGVIREADIVACRNGQVTFRYREAKSATVQRRMLSGAQFLWLMLQHVLPKGFRRARNFGFLHPNSKRLIALLRWLLKFVPAPLPLRARPAVPCPCCGAAMRILRTRLRPIRPPACASPPGGNDAGVLIM